MMQKHLQALIVEDSHSDALLLLRELRRAGYEVDYTRVDNAVDMQAALESVSWDIILSDFSMPNFSATAALKIVKEHRLNVPFIIVSGTMGEEAAVAAMKAGASDYFPKGRMTRLGAAIERELREAEERQRRHEAEDQLRQAEARFTQAFQANPSAISIKTLKDDIVLDANPRFLELFGYSREELVGKRMSELGIWINQLEQQQQVQVLHKQGSIRNYETRLQSNTQGIRDVLISLELIILDGDVCILSFIHDITERKQAENELASLYNATSALFKGDTLLSLGQQIVEAVVQEFEQFDCGLILVNRNQHQLIRLARGGEQGIQTDQPLYLDGKGLVPEAIRSKKMIYVPDVNLDSRYVSNVSHTASELVIPLETAKGVIGAFDLQSDQTDAFSERDQRILSTFAERAAAAIETMSLYEEINLYANDLEQRVAQRTAELQNAKEHIEGIFNNSSDAIALIDGDGYIQQTNLAFNQLFGYESDALFGRLLIEISEQTQVKTIQAAIKNAIQNNQSVRVELVVQHQDKTTLNVDLALAPLISAASQATQVICSFRDITERKQMEENLRQTLAKERELSELKSRFTSMVSHEFRTPLAVIQTSADLLKRYYDSFTNEKRLDYLNRIQSQIRHLTHLMEDVLALGRAQAVGIDFTPAPFNLESFCRTVIAETQANTSNHQIQFVVIGVCSDILADAKLIRQMLTNLLSNAIKYSPQGGDIHITLSCQTDETTLSIQDTGIGIPEKDLTHLFEDFHRASNVANIQGTGLGLAIVKQAVEAHKGTIHVTSNVGFGTTFTIILSHQ